MMTKTDAAKLVKGLTPKDIFDVKELPDGRIGIVTVDGQKHYAEKPKEVKGGK